MYRLILLLAFAPQSLLPHPPVEWHPVTTWARKQWENQMMLLVVDTSPPFCIFSRMLMETNLKGYVLAYFRHWKQSQVLGKRHGSYVLNVTHCLVHVHGFSWWTFPCILDLYAKKWYPCLEWSGAGWTVGTEFWCCQKSVLVVLAFLFLWCESLKRKLARRVAEWDDLATLMWKSWAAADMQAVNVATYVHVHENMCKERSQNREF